MSPTQATKREAPLPLTPNTWTSHDGSEADEIDFATPGHTFIVTEIEDDDLCFGGKPLSAWYEEERTRQSIAYIERAEEERRGRPRERTNHQHHAQHAAKNHTDVKR